MPRKKNDPAAPPAEGVMVRCLGPRCDRHFLSRDKATNRICPACTRKIKDMDPVRVARLGSISSTPSCPPSPPDD